MLFLIQADLRIYSNDTVTLGFVEAQSREEVIKMLGLIVDEAEGWGGKTTQLFRAEGTLEPFYVIPVCALESRDQMISAFEAQRDHMRSLMNERSSRLKREGHPSIA